MAEIHKCGPGWAYCDGNCATCAANNYYTITGTNTQVIAVKNPPPYIDFSKERKKQTNADKIRQMTDEELAHLIAGDWCELVNCPDLVCNGQCEERVLEWLKEDLDPTPQNEEKHEIGEQGAGLAEEGGGRVMAELNFYWRWGDYALESCDEPSVALNLVKYYQHDGREMKYPIGRFWWDDHDEPRWELTLIGEQLMAILDSDAVAVLRMLKAAYNTLEARKRRESNG